MPVQNTTTAPRFIPGQWSSLATKTDPYISQKVNRQTLDPIGKAAASFTKYPVDQAAFAASGMNPQQQQAAFTQNVARRMGVQFGNQDGTGMGAYTGQPGNIFRNPTHLPDVMFMQPQQGSMASQVQNALFQKYNDHAAGLNGQWTYGNASNPFTKPLGLMNRLQPQS